MLRNVPQYLCTFGNCRRLTKCWTSGPLLIAEILRSTRHIVFANRMISNLDCSGTYVCQQMWNCGFEIWEFWHLKILKWWHFESSETSKLWSYEIYNFRNVQHGIRKVWNLTILKLPNVEFCKIYKLVVSRGGN